MSNGPPPARPDGPVDNARWLFPQEPAPPPLNEALILLFADLEAKLNARFDAFEAKLEARMSWPTATGSTLRIEAVCAHQVAHLEASMADFRSFADDLDQRQPSTHASFASLDEEDDDLEKDKAIPIAPSIDDANVEFEDIAVVHAPPPPLPYTGAFVPFLGGECPLSSPNMLSAFESATVPPQKTASRLKRPRCRPCHRNRPRAPNPADEAIPSHPQSMMGGTSMPTITLPATSARATTHCSMTSSPMSFAMPSSSSPSLQPFMLHEKGRNEKGEGDANQHQQKGTCRRIRPRLGPPIHWIIFFVVGVIGLGPLINLLNGLSLKCGFYTLGFVVWILVLWKSFWKTVFLG
jgi:hypothetical protein